MNGATNHVAENAYLWECTIVVTRFFKVVLAIFNAAKSGFIPAWVEMNVKPADVVDEMNS